MGQKHRENKEGPKKAKIQHGVKPDILKYAEGHAEECAERYCELANKTTQQLYNVSTPCNDDHHFKEEELKSVGEVSKVCSQTVLKFLYLARVGRPDILWFSEIRLHDQSQNGPRLVTNA